MHSKRGLWVGAAVLLVAKAWSALSKFTGLENFKAAYWHGLVLNSRAVMMHAVMPSSNGALPCYQRVRVHRKEPAVTTEKKVDKPALEYSEAVDHAVRLSTS